MNPRQERKISLPLAGYEAGTVWMILRARSIFVLFFKPPKHPVRHGKAAEYTTCWIELNYIVLCMRLITLYWDQWPYFAFAFPGRPSFRLPRSLCLPVAKDLHRQPTTQDETPTPSEQLRPCLDLSSTTVPLYVCLDF